MITYNNSCITDEVIESLAICNGRILDLGGGLSPYYRADAIVDIAPYDAERLAVNSWGRTVGGIRCKVQCEDGTNSITTSVPSLNLAPSTFDSSPRWSPSDYIQLDATKEKMPFADNEFDLGLSSHMLEDVENPFPAFEELNRVSKRVAIIAPSRLIEQTKGIDHPRHCGFGHHKWMLEHEGDHIVFTRKGELIEKRGCHIGCPLGKTMTLQAGVFFHVGENVIARQRVFKDHDDEIENLSSFVDRFQNRRALFQLDARALSLRSWIWRFKQWAFGAE
jgi:hypothetical protein